MADNLSRRETGKLPTQPENGKPNQEQVKAITLRNNKTYESPVAVPSQPKSSSPFKKGITVNLDGEEGDQTLSPEDIARCTPPVPFPQALNRPKKSKGHLDEDILEILKNGKVNILIVEAVKQLPCYAKFLKDLIT